jgi:hypothetical protein
LLIGRIYSRSPGPRPGRRVEGDKRQYLGKRGFCRRCGLFAAAARIKMGC